MNAALIDGRRLRLPGESRLPEHVAGLIRVYRAFDRAAARWSSAAEVACPAGCGRCCEGIVPESTAGEAELIARWLMSARPGLVDEVLARPPSPSPPCPFYDQRTPAHCTIYPVRPFLCRAFASAGYRDKHGATVYRLCEHMPAPPAFGGRRQLAWRGRTAEPGAEGAAFAPARAPATLPAPPVTGDYRRRFQATDGAGAGDREALDAALRAAMHRLLLRQQFLLSERRRPRSA